MLETLTRYGGVSLINDQLTGAITELGETTMNDKTTETAEAAGREASDVERIVILRNDNGIEIVEGMKDCGHYKAVGAECCCGEVLIVAPAIFMADHKKGDPVMVCGDHGVHAYRFKDLVLGKQPAI